MLKLDQIAYISIISTSRQPRWWIFGFLQVIAVFLVIPFLVRPSLAYSPYVFSLTASVIILSLATVWLWMDIDARKFRNLKLRPVKFFVKSCLTTGGIILCVFIITLGLRLLFVPWVFFALLSSLVTATAVLAMLYAVLCEQSFLPALGLALDTWNKKISLAAIVALVLILGYGISFAFFHGLLGSRGFKGEFPVSSHSATIWVLFLVLMVLTAFLAALLNCFLVFLFLEIIRLKKDPEAQELVMPKQPILEPNI